MPPPCPPPKPPPPPPPPPPPRANATVGETRPTHETANNAITALRNITILRQRYRSLPQAHCRWRSFRKTAIGFDESVAQVFASDAKLNLKLENESSA